MSVVRIDVFRASRLPPSGAEQELTERLRTEGVAGVEGVRISRLYFLEGDVPPEIAREIAQSLLADPVIEASAVYIEGEKDPPNESGVAFEILPRPGVMDPVAETVLAELRAEGIPVRRVRTGRRYVVAGEADPEAVLAYVRRWLANDCIEEVVAGTVGVRPMPVPPVRAFERRTVPIRELDEAGLRELSRRGHLFLSLVEMRVIQRHFAEAGREPTDLELETLAQTWSEHCVHKTLKSEVVYRGAPLPNREADELRYGNLLRDTIARATRELIAEGRGPQCLSVFEDNAGVIGFDEKHGIAFKVETHNRPSAIEPYGGAATGVGGCIRDVLGCGLGARPIANTDVFCVGPQDWRADRLPKGVLHPRRILHEVVRGVADYGNRMGIPTVNGAVYIDPRYLGNPLVYCGCVGLIPRDKVQKGARRGDRIVLIGGRTGRDGIHGATFSSAELTDTHVDEFAHAVQIGNAITEKRVLDGLLAARDDAQGCLYSAVTDCGAGGLSSAIGEMGREIGATVDLEHVPLKYAGLRYDEIWISEAQERMVLAVAPDRLERFLGVMRDEEVEATVIGTFGAEPTPRLVVRYEGVVVGDLDMKFLHEGLPRAPREAFWRPNEGMTDGAEGEAGGGRQIGTAAERTVGRDARRTPVDGATLIAALEEQLASPNVAGHPWIIRRYDHEVQGATVVKPLGGPGLGPNDAAVLRPLADSWRGIAIGCGLAPELFEVDPYWSAIAAIDEAVRNVVCVGGDPKRTAILDNFCWGRTDDPRQLGALVRACQACYDAAIVFGTPFISGKDSLNNEFALDEADVERLIEELRIANSEERIQKTGGSLPNSFFAIRNSQFDALGLPFEAVAARIRETRRLSVPGTLLISAMALVEDVRAGVTADLKRDAGPVYLVGGLPRIGTRLMDALRIHHALAELIRGGAVAACHDVSDGGWLAALAEMARGGLCGVRVQWGEERGKGAEGQRGKGTEEGDASDCGSSTPAFPNGHGPFERLNAAYVVQARDAQQLEGVLNARSVAYARVGTVTEERAICVGEGRMPLLRNEECRMQNA